MFVDTRNRNSGFTLIEMLITVAVAGIVISIAVPNYITWIKDLRIRRATDALSTSLSKARNEAQRRQSRVSLCRTGNPYAASPVCEAAIFGTSTANADNDWSYGWLVYETDTIGAAYDSTNADHDLIEAIATETGDLDVTIMADDDAEDSLTFASNGQFASDSPVFTVCDDRQTSGDGEKGYRLEFGVSGRSITYKFGDTLADGSTLVDDDCTP